MDRSGYEQLDRIESLLEQVAEKLELNQDEEDDFELDEDNDSNSKEILD